MRTDLDLLRAENLGIELARQFIADAPVLSPAIGAGRAIILCGPPCAGKTTLARSVAERLGLHRISVDEVRMQHFQEAEYYQPYTFHALFVFTINSARAILERKESFVCDGLFLDHRRVDAIVALAGASNCAVLHLFAALPVLRTRLANRMALCERDGSPVFTNPTFEQLEALYHASVSRMHPLSMGLRSDLPPKTVEDGALSLLGRKFGTNPLGG